MKLIKGEYTDCLKVNQPQETWRSAENMVFDIDSLKNEDGLLKSTSFGTAGYITIGELYLPNNKTLFFETSVSGDRIMLKDNSNFISVPNIVTNFNFGFSVAYPIVAKAKYTSDLNIEVVFTDNYNPPRHITIDKITNQIIETTIEQTKLFPEISIPNFILKSVDSGGFLSKGSYHVSIAYNFGDDDYTNWVGLSNQIVLTSGGQGFTIQIDDLDTKFESFKVGLIHVVDDLVITAEETIIDYNISTSSKTITVVGNGTDINLANITLKTISYDKVGDLDALDNRLYLAKLYRDATLDYQQYANNIRIEPIYDDLVALDSEEGSYADPVIIFDKVGFQDDEIYAFYIRLHLKDGTIGGDFFIPCAGYNGMLIHTNIDEDYPLNKDYPLGNVKHHLFPKKTAANFLQGTSGSGVAADATRVSGAGSNQAITTDVKYGVKFASPTGALGTVSNDEVEAVITNNSVTFADALTLTINYTVDMEANVTAVGAEVVNLVYEIRRYSTGSGSYSDLVAKYSAIYTPNADRIIALNEAGSVDVTVSPGEKISFNAQLLISVGDATVVRSMASTWSMVIKDLLPSTDANFFTKPTGIKATNIVIPVELEDKIEGYELMYASRNGTNSRVIGQSIVYPENFISDKTINTDGKARFHSFDVLLDKPSIYPSDIRGQYEIEEVNIASGGKYVYLGNTIIDSTVSSEIVQAKYIPGNNVAASNEDGEEHYSFLVKTGFTPVDRLIANLITTKNNYYLGFETQILQSTGKVFKISGAGTYSIDKLYGGDTYTCIYDLRLTKYRSSGITDKYIRNTKIPVQSRSNIYLREWGNNWYEQAELLYPPESEYEVLGLDDTTLATQGITSVADKALARTDYTKQYSNYFKYDKAYSFGNKFLQGQIQGETIDDSPFRIIRSPEQNLESKTSSWRTFLSNDYYEQNRDRGIINNIAVLDTDKLIIHHTNGLFITNAKEKLSATVTEILIGAGDIFERAPKEIIFTDKGTLGSNHKFANFVCELGYVFISNGKIYTLSNELKDLTKGESKFFYDNLNTGDNPYLQDRTNVNYTGGISIAYDHKYERLLISVHKLNSSYTKSFSLRLDNWTGSHSWTDCKVFNSNNELFSLRYKSSTTITELYKHNDPTSKCKYYDDVVYDSSLSLIANRDEGDKIFNNVNWKITRVENNKNFKTIRVRSDYDDTGEITIVPFSGDIYVDFNTRRKHSTWYFNRLLVNVGDLGNDNLITGLFALIDLTIDNTDQEEIAIIDIDYEYEKIEIQ